MDAEQLGRPWARKKRLRKKVEYDRQKLKDDELAAVVAGLTFFRSCKRFDVKVKLWANGRSRCSPGRSVAAMCPKESVMDSMTVLKWPSKENGAGSCDGCESW